MTKCIRSPPTRLGKLYRSTLRDHVKVTFVVFLIWAFYCSIAPCSCNEDANSEIYLPFCFQRHFSANGFLCRNCRRQFRILSDTPAGPVAEQQPCYVRLASFCKSLKSLKNECTLFAFAGVSHCVRDSLGKHAVKVHASALRLFVAECVGPTTVALQLGTFIACVLSEAPSGECKKSGPDERCAISSRRNEESPPDGKIAHRKLIGTALARGVRFAEGRPGVRKRGMEYGVTKSGVNRSEPDCYGPGLCTCGM